METRTVHISDPLAEGLHWHFQVGQRVRLPNSDICCACLSRRSIDDATEVTRVVQETGLKSARLAQTECSLGDRAGARQLGA